MRWSTKSKTLVSILVVISLSLPIGLFVLYNHDNPTGLVKISEINDGLIPSGTNVTVKGRIVGILLTYLGQFDQLVTISDGNNNLTFGWVETPLDPGWTVIVNGYVSSNTSLYTYSVEKVLLFI